MHAVALLTLALVTQTPPPPTMLFKNDTRGQITVWVYCRSHAGWANNQRPLVVRPGATVRFKLHEGYFQVVAINQYQTVRNNRVLKTGELDKMRLAAMYSGKQRPRFDIVDDNDTDDDDNN
jgi:hypothetical protein